MKLVALALNDNSTMKVTRSFYIQSLCVFGDVRTADRFTKIDQQGNAQSLCLICRRASLRD